LAPFMTCRVVRLVYFGSTLTVVCRPCASISRSVNSASPPSVNPPWRNEVNDNSSCKPALRMGANQSDENGEWPN